MFLWELKNAIISTKSSWTLCYRNSKTKQKNSTHSGFDKLSHRVIYYYSRCLSLLKARSQFSSRCLSLSKAHYFYFIKIRALLRTSLMFLWELKNTIISTNLRELCVIKANTNIPHIVASWTSFADFQSVLSHQTFYYTVPEPVEGTFSILISVPEPVEGTFSLLISVPEPVEGTLFLFY